ncbi:hypothetical protein DMH01_41555 [Amycolatopsis sp. WAC 04182]|uniref:hypothetical protein n=1 Tax=Amycolatopsis sp. WAC 04182 TaxID=2203198 RepID=UPI000F78C8D6|nr:hypothetical protein [Amycolatopsis sp. WAC 04182]RSN52658.1 hypothetical protein DMH01_41555 [Amycolatopsis sp. WAC 04182]
MTSPAAQLESALAATITEKTARGSTDVLPSPRGWHPGARVGATAEHGALLAYNDDGSTGICVLENGRGRWLNLQSEGQAQDFTDRPYSVWQWMPAYNGRPVWLLGGISPEAARLELAGNDGTVAEAAIVDGTFAAEIAVDMVSLRNAKGRLESHAPDSDEGRAEFERLLADSRTEMTQLKVRVYDSAGALLYDGAAIDATD